MADSRIIYALDEKLMNEGIIDRQYAADYAKVHSMLNGSFRKTGAALPDKVFADGEVKLRKWLMSMYRLGASQDKLTSYLRCGLAHLSFDYIESSYKSISNDDLITRVLQSFKNREYHKSFFRASETAKPVKKKKATKKKKTKAVKKKKPVKKSKKKAAKKTKKKALKTRPVKKAAKKRSTRKTKNKKSMKRKKGSVRKKTGKIKKSKAKKKGKRKQKSLFVRLFS